jgi:Zn-dependent oligopeptidase
MLLHTTWHLFTCTVLLATLPTGYGAGYYAYLYDRVLAASIWDKVLATLSLTTHAVNL